MVGRFTILRGRQMVRPLPHREEPARRLVVAGCLAVLALLPAAPASGRKSSGSLPGKIPNAPPYLAGFPIPFPRASDYRPQDGAVVAADLEGSGRMSLVVSIPSGIVTVIRHDGSVAPGWPRDFAALPAPAYPVGAAAIGDLDGDGSPEVVLCVEAGLSPRHNFLYAFRADGSDLPGWPIEILSGANPYYSCSPSGALLVDLDGDGRPEVIHAMNPGEVQVFRGDGVALPGWPFRAGPDALGHHRGINADLAAADLDGDGRPEVILVETGYQPRLLAVSGNGAIARGFPIVLPEVVDRQAPAAADLNGDGTPELVQATLPFDGIMLDGPTPGTATTFAPAVPPASGDVPVPGELHVLRADGSAAPGWPLPLSTGAPWGALAADLDGDGRPEILQQDGDLLYAFDPGGAVLPRFPITLRRDFVRSDATQYSPWIVVDLDGDRRPDLLQVRTDLYAGSSYLRVFGLRATGDPLRGYPFEADGLSAASRPITTDLDGDGANDLVLLAAGGSGGSYSLLAWNLGALVNPQGPRSYGRSAARSR
jgi:hypothetical protein